MKKMKNGLLKSAVLGMGIVLLLLAGCANEPEAKVTQEEHNAKSNELIKFNTKDAKYLATQWAKKTNGRSAESEALDSLIALVPETDEAGNPVTDENGDIKLEEVDAMEVPKEELKLADWCIPQPVREVYTCPYAEAEAEAKGVYTVFAGYIDWWQYTDGTPAPGISMVMYVKPDGNVIDVLNIDGNVRYFLTTWIKENDGEDYLQFDDSGNLFMLVHDDVKDEFVIIRYNPASDMIDTYKLNLGTKAAVEIRNFTVTKDGKYVFLNVMVNKLKNNVYVMPINSGAAPVALYEYEPEEEPKEATWAVSTIAFNPLTNNVYWYVDEYNDPLRPNSGLYVARKTSSGYTKDAVKRHAAIGYWDFINVLETKATGNSYSLNKDDPEYEEKLIPTPETPDYKAVIDYLKKAGGYNDDYQFDLSYFKDKNAVEVINWEGESETIDFSGLYAEDDDTGKVLADEAALKYLVNTTYIQAYGEPEGYDATDPNWDWVKDWGNKRLISQLNDFFLQYWCEPYKEPGNEVIAGAGGYKDAGYSLPFSGDGLYITPVFPYDVFIHNKTTGKSFGKDTMDETYIKSELSRNYNGIILSNDEGTWLLNDVWSSKTEDNDYALMFKLTDENGNFVCTQPNKLQFKPRWSKDYAREETDPWYKKPFAANSKGVAALAQGGKTIYYHSGNETVDLLKDSTYKFSFIYSFNLYEDTLVCNGVKDNGGYIMLSIDLKSGKITKLPLEKKVESMLSL